MYRLKKLFNPEIFQGKYKKKNYFEGWYYKLVDKDGKNSFALIPGVAFDKDKNAHAFVQIIDSIGYDTDYFKFPLEDFAFSESDLDVSVGDNHFKRSSITVSLKNDKNTVYGDLEFYDIEEFPKTILRPGIMGPFSFVPTMECYHGVVNIHQKIKGSLMINDKLVDFTNGYGYIEKDWGKSFPKWWVWMQSNHFEQDDVSLMFSIAKIPWLKNHFTGFLSFLKIGEKMYLFATYTGAKVKTLEYTNGDIFIVVKDRKHTLTITGKYKESGVLRAPKNGLMERIISESISSTIKVVLTNHNGDIIFDDYGENAGLEVVGKPMNK